MRNETEMRVGINSAGRRLFLRQSVVAVAGLAALPTALLGCSRVSESATATHSAAAESGGGGGALTWNTRIGTDAEPGTPLVVAGTIYAADGRTPLEGATLYVYHTDARGIYADKQGDPARLRGWMRTGRDGRYEFRTIRPARYPGDTMTAHIHSSVKGPRAEERWITDFWFDGDNKLPRHHYDEQAALGPFSSVLKLTRGADGAWRGTRDIRVG